MRRTAKRLPLILLTLLALSGATDAADFFVAVDGSDADPGTQARPFATLARAHEALREKIAAGLSADVQVCVEGGTYRITEPIVLGPEDGGTQQYSVTYAAAAGATPTISGGRVIGPWKATSDGNWTAEIPQVADGQWTFRQLFVDGRRAVRARGPNEGWFRVEKVGPDRRTSFQYASGDLSSYGGLENVELVFLHDWSLSRVPIASIDEATRRLTAAPQIGGSSSWAVMDWFEKQPRYFLENAAELLDSAGEWFLDVKTGVITYKPLAGERLDQVEIVAPVAHQLLVVQGDPATGRTVRNVHFRGLTFEHAAWRPANHVYWGRQACTYWTTNPADPAASHEEADPAAVQFDLAQGCSFSQGRLAHVGASGIWFGRGSRNNRLSATIVSDTGGNGVMIGEGQARRIDDKSWWETSPEQAAQANAVEHCLVEHCGQELFGAVGVWVGLAAETTIANNEIRRHPYTGVSIGWMWWNPTARPEPRKTPCRETRVVDNHIHDCMLTLSDGGCIYALGVQPDSVLRGNLIHGVRANAGRAESNGMFLDQGTGGFVIEENVIYDVTRSPLRFHKGWTNLVRNNVLEVSQGVPPVRYNDTRQERIRLENNTIVPEVSAEVIEAATRRAGPLCTPGPGVRR